MVHRTSIVGNMFYDDTGMVLLATEYFLMNMNALPPKISKTYLRLVMLEQMANGLSLWSWN
jgi:hypothetical protein